MQRVHFQVRVSVFNCQQILAKISFVIFDNEIKKTNRMWFSVALMKFHWSGINWHVFNQSVACILSCRKSRHKTRHKPNLKSTSKYGFPPILGGKKLWRSWACTCKLCWTLLSPVRVQPLYGAERKESSGTGLSMRMHVILDSLFARPGLASTWGGKKREFRDWTRQGRDMPTSV